jgi:glutamate/aspartate transport system permease protein
MENFDFSAVLHALPYLIKTGLAFSFKLTLLAGVMGLVLGTGLALMRLSPIRSIALVAGAYVNLMRSIPLLLVIFWFYFLVPYIAAWIVHSPTPVEIGAFKSAVITFTAFEAAYYCEIMRAGIQSIPRGQSFAGLALGLSRWQTMRSVVLPQAFRNMLPSLLTSVIILFQDTSLVYVLSLTDFLGAATEVGTREGRVVEFYIFVAVTYFVICFGFSRLVKGFEKSVQVSR